MRKKFVVQISCNKVDGPSNISHESPLSCFEQALLNTNVDFLDVRGSLVEHKTSQIAH